MSKFGAFDPKVTKAGTQLPLLNLKGKPYLQVAHRLVWFREVYPDGVIKTQILHNQDNTAIVRAEVYSSAQGGLLASAHKMESKENFNDFIEKAETGAIGRALAMASFGTQFEPEFDEGVRLADAPIDVATKTTTASSTVTVTAETSTPVQGTATVARPSFRKKAETSKATDDNDGM